jgi:2-octaprenyl-6-methoxyphenol hydroxylase
MGGREICAYIQLMKKADVLILGAGLNGLGLALSLGGRSLPRPLNVMVLDARDPNHVPADSRGTAVTQATQNMFAALGIWQTLALHAAEMRDIIVTNAVGSHQDRPSLLSFTTDGDQKAAAAIVENGQLHRALLQEVQQSPAIALQGGFAFSDLLTTSGKVELIATDGRTVSATLLVAADGRNSSVRQHLGIAVTRHDYGQTALSSSIRHSLPHNNLAEEHFSPDGVFAVLPLPGQRSSIVWGTTPREASRLLALSEADFATELQIRMGDRLGLVQAEAKRGAYPLVRQIADHIIGPRVALLGDAAHAIHPLAGLGLNLGFKDAAALADCLMQAASRGEDLGGVAVLERYQLARRFDTTMTSFAMDAMNALFVNDSPVLSPLRSAGLKLVDHWPAAKSFFMQQASGLSQDNPRLMRGLLPG